MSTLRPTADEAFTEYAALVAANREQVERLREALPQQQGDFWAGRAPEFRPGNLDAPEMDALAALSRPEDTWLDIGAGGGRFAVPLSRHVARVVAIEPSQAMRAVLLEAAAAASTTVETIDLRWPPGATDVPVPLADASLAANVLYDITDLREFLEAMEAYTRRTCVVIVSDRAPSTPDAGVWEALYGEPLHALPALREFVAILGALGRTYEVHTFPVAPPEPVDAERAVEEVRWRYWIQPGSERAARLRALLIERFGEPSGLVRLPARRNYTAVVSWGSPSR